jgi:succinate dehydrogenase / fumarate reductase flavoprotein subunit
MKLEAKIPSGPLADKWTDYKAHTALVSPANKRKHTILIVGTGLAGGGAAAALGELGYKVKAFCYQDSARRAHSIAAQGGINAAKNYQNDGDTVFRLFYDTIKGGDFRAREANTYRLAEISNEIIDQCVAQGVPFGREYSGYLANRTFGGAQVSRTFYARGETGQQLLLGAYNSLNAQVNAGNVDVFERTEMLDLIVIDGVARGIVVRDMVSGEVSSHFGDAVLLCTGGYSNVFFLSTSAKGCNGSAVWRAYKRGAGFANPSFTQIHPTAIPQSGDFQSKLTLMSESLRNDGRVWVPKKAGDDRPPNDIPEDERDYYLERIYPSFGNMVPRDVASRNAKNVCDEGRGIGPTKRGVYLDFTVAIERLGVDVIKDRYGNLFEMYEMINDEDPYTTPMMIYPAPHYTMGGLWVDYDLMSNIPGLFVLGEANFSDHGANRLGASALMQGLADGFFVIPNTLGQYIAKGKHPDVDPSCDEVRKVEQGAKDFNQKLLDIKGTKTVDYFHRAMGMIMLDKCGMARSKEGLNEAIEKIGKIKEEFWADVKVPGTGESLNQELEKAGRLADYFDLAILMCMDAREREESCGGHFREEHKTEEGEAKRDDENMCHVTVWEHMGEGQEPKAHKEELDFEYVELTQRSYK